ncbi:potassium-transporting ATPase subunit KdpA [Enemella evansiae]|uniref:potassium-transporting ATPase subunit KdpA n=1 Tax=Enemella evansiae TaxID=2016499 RepID=UPI000B9650D5|nr:potassium-transporting ATPase subunit KdpA [Enemella evansiae]OYO13977.1 potassium-transporting ATPase subunit KdpA [Enemella evansiae]TDO89614.1 K+-transporting ATPase ATPase A chain [Enemella evansiae]
MGATTAGLLQAGLLIGLLAACHVPLGRLLHGTATGERDLRAERAIYRAIGVDPRREQSWRHYLLAVLAFSLAGVLVLYALLRLQQFLPLGLGRAGFDPTGAFNTAISFVTNTNWQWYSGDSAAGHLVQMAGLAVQNFVSAATGIAVAFALVRGFARTRADEIGNFWVDLTRITLRVLLPLAVLVTLLFVAGGAIQNLAAPHLVDALGGGTQTIPGGPVASQEAIKQLGTNGGGFFNANASHPFENPNPATNLLSMWAMLVIPFSLPYAFGRMVGDRRQGLAIVGVQATLWLTSVVVITASEVTGRGAAPATAAAAMEGKEQRFGEWASALYAASTTGTSTGAVNSMHDSFTAAGGGMAMLNMMLGEVSPGGVGTGLYGILMLAVLTVFIGGLMVGRTPEYLGKKIGQREITLVALAILAMPFALLVGASIAISTSSGLGSLTNSGSHGLSEMLYGFASAANNNGSAFAGLSAGTPLLNIALGLAMLIGRFLPIACTLGLAGALARQQKIPVSAGTLPTHGPLFVGMVTAVVLIVAGLTFFPALSLGPIAEALS